MRRIEVEQALRASAEVTGETEFIIVGSQSLHAHTLTPPVEVIVSMECDLYARAHPEKATVLRERLGRDTPFHRAHGFYVDAVNPEQIQLARGWDGRLRRFELAGVAAWCLSVEDLVIAKLFAGRLKNYEFVATVLKGRLADPQTIARLIANFEEVRLRAVLGARMQVASQSG